MFSPLTGESKGGGRPIQRFPPSPDDGRLGVRADHGGTEDANGEVEIERGIRLSGRPPPFEFPVSGENIAATVLVDSVSMATLVTKTQLTTEP